MFTWIITQRWNYVLLLFEIPMIMLWLQYMFFSRMWYSTWRSCRLWVPSCSEWLNVWKWINVSMLTAFAVVTPERRLNASVFPNQHRPNVGESCLQKVGQLLGVLRLLRRTVPTVPQDNFRQGGWRIRRQTKRTKYAYKIVCFWIWMYWGRKYGVVHKRIITIEYTFMLCPCSRCYHAKHDRRLQTAASTIGKRAARTIEKCNTHHLTSFESIVYHCFPCRTWEMFFYVVVLFVIIHCIRMVSSPIHPNFSRDDLSGSKSSQSVFVSRLSTVINYSTVIRFQDLLSKSPHHVIKCNKFMHKIANSVYSILQPQKVGWNGYGLRHADLSQLQTN